LIETQNNWKKFSWKFSFWSPRLQGSKTFNFPNNVLCPRQTKENLTSIETGELFASSELIHWTTTASHLVFSAILYLNPWFSWCRVGNKALPLFWATAQPDPFKTRSLDSLGQILRPFTTHLALACQSGWAVVTMEGAHEGRPRPRKHNQNHVKLELNITRLFSIWGEKKQAQITINASLRIISHIYKLQHTFQWHKYSSRIINWTKF